MKIAIIDDEYHCIESLVIHLNTLFPEVNIVYQTNKVQEALTELPKLKIDLLFLDIQMPGLNGFQLLEQLPKRQFDVIFITAYSQYAIQAFKAKAINYLLKPIDSEELKEAIEEWQKTKEKQQDTKEQLTQLLKYLKKEGLLKSKISVPISDGYEFIEVKKIEYCQSQSNYTKIILSDGDKLLISKTLKEIDKTLAPFFFIRVHQSYLINPNHLKKYHRRGGNYLVMQSGQEIPVSSQRQKLITEFFETATKN